MALILMQHTKEAVEENSMVGMGNTDDTGANACKLRSARTTMITTSLFLLTSERRAATSSMETPLQSMASEMMQCGARAACKHFKCLLLSTSAQASTSVLSRCPSKCSSAEAVVTNSSSSPNC